MLVTVGVMISKDDEAIGADSRITDQVLGGGTHTSCSRGQDVAFDALRSNSH